LAELKVLKYLPSFPYWSEGKQPMDVQCPPTDRQYLRHRLYLIT